MGVWRASVSNSSTRLGSDADFVEAVRTGGAFRELFGVVERFLDTF
jgi:hypothetical protein